MQLVWHNCYLYIIIFAIKKTKISKNILNKKSLSASIIAFILQFLSEKKQKQIYMTSLMILLSLYYNFYN